MERYFPFWTVWIDMLLPLPSFTAWTMEPAVILRWEFFALCKLCWALHRWAYKWQMQMHISVLSMHWSLLFFFQSINSVILMLCSFFTACMLREWAEDGETLPLLNSVDWHVTLNIFLLATWIMEPAVTLRWVFFAYCVNCQALHRWAYKWHKYISTQVT